MKTMKNSFFCSRKLVWLALLLTSIFLYMPWFFLSFSLPLIPNCRDPSPAPESQDRTPWSGDLRQLETAWNNLSFGQNSLKQSLKIALFVKKWPFNHIPGGMERHALTLHRELARRGHILHIFTTVPSHGDQKQGDENRSLHFHFTKPTAAGNFNQVEAWSQFLKVNTTEGFDIIHSESVCLPYWKVRNLTNVVASWHGIAYEIIHSDIVQDLTRKPHEPRTLNLHKALSERVLKVIEEVKFFPSYAHHVATSDYAAEVLRSIYMIPLQNVHVILNGVDPATFRPNPERGKLFRATYGVPANARLVLGVAGRLVKDKGHPILFEALKQILPKNKDIFVLVAGEGPWAGRYRELAPQVKVIGPLSSGHLADFYNALDIFVNPTLRSQGLDHTLLEAMLCGKPVLGTHFSSITRTVIVNAEMGYTFYPRVDSVKAALEKVIEDGKDVLRRKGMSCGRRASLLFTASKMASAYERLFLCIAKGGFCEYPRPWD